MSFLDLDSKDTKGEGSSPFLLNPVATTVPTPAQRQNQDAADEEALLAEFHKNPEAALRMAKSYISAAQAPRQAMTEITPVAGFVLQTTTTKESSKVPIGAKTIVFPKDTQVFVNICSSSQLPKPSVATEAEIQKAINAEEGTTYQVPFQLSPPREYKDTGMDCRLENRDIDRICSKETHLNTVVVFIIHVRCQELPRGGCMCPHRRVQADREGL